VNAARATESSEVRSFLLEAPFHLGLQLLSGIASQELCFGTGVNHVNVDFHFLLLHVSDSGVFLS